MDKSAPDAKEIAIRLEGSQPMRGSVDGGGRGGRVRFVGWLSLLAALERLFNDRSAGPPIPARSSKRSSK